MTYTRRAPVNPAAVAYLARLSERAESATLALIYTRLARQMAWRAEVQGVRKS